MLRALLAIALLTTAGCETTVNPNLAPIDADGQSTATPAPPSQPVIAALDVPSKAVIGSESFEISFDVTKAGSGTISQYGLKSRLGSQLFKPQYPLPVINNGHVKLSAAGPLPNLTEAGDLDCEFWVVDSNGQESNHLGFKMKVQ